MGHRLYSIAELTAILQPADQVVEDPDLQIDTLAYDSRKLRNGGGALFFALKGLRDGHRFLGEAYEAGVRNFVIADRKQMASGNFPGANFLIVEDTLSAMQELAAFHRARFHYPVIAITGSNGKTIVKDWLYQLLSPHSKKPQKL